MLIKDIQSVMWYTILPLFFYGHIFLSLLFHTITDHIVTLSNTKMTYIVVMQHAAMFTSHKQHADAYAGNIKTV